jgi:chromosome segregation ATPase
MVMVLLLAGCTTTKKVDEMIDSKMNPQIESIDAKFEAQTAARNQVLEDMKDFVDRLGRTLNKDVKVVEAGVADLKDQVAAVKKNVSKIDVQSVANTVNDLESSVGSLGDSIDQLNVKTATIKQSVETLQQAEKARTEAEAAAAEAKAALPEKGMFHKHPAGVVE